MTERSEYSKRREGEDHGPRDGHFRGGDGGGRGHVRGVDAAEGRIAGLIRPARDRRVVGAAGVARLVAERAAQPGALAVVAAARATGDQS